jgi:general secretion pathway protein M
MRALSLPSLRSLSPRERLTLAIGGVIAAILLVLVVLLPLERRVAHLRRAVERQQANLAWMRRVAPELAAAGTAPVGANEPLIVLIDQSAHQAGLGTALTASAPSGTGLSVQLRDAPFDLLITWLARLRRQDGVQVTGAQIRAAGGPGLVDASLKLKQP